MQVLSGLSVGLRLLELERATEELSIRSVQVATEGLLAEKVLRRDRQGHFRVSPRSSVAKTIVQMFGAVRDEETRKKAERLSDRARLVVSLSNEVGKISKAPSKPRE